MDPLSFDRPPSLSQPTLVLAFTGWSDAGTAASTAVQYVAERTNATRIGRIDGEELFDFTVQRPTVRLDAHGIRTLEWPAYEILAAEGHDLVFLVGPEPHLRWRLFCDLLLRALRTLGVVRVGLLGAFLAEVSHADPVALTGFASDLELLERVRISPTAYQGPTGIVGTFADALRRESIPYFSLWAAVPHYIAAMTNPRAALALLLKLREWIPLPIDLAPLESIATAFQAKLLEAVEDDSSLSTYVRGLKKGETSH